MSLKTVSAERHLCKFLCHSHGTLASPKSCDVAAKMLPSLHSFLFRAVSLPLRLVTQVYLSSLPALVLKNTQQGYSIQSRWRRPWKCFAVLPPLAPSWFTVFVLLFRGFFSSLFVRQPYFLAPVVCLISHLLISTPTHRGQPWPEAFRSSGCPVHRLS